MNKGPSVAPPSTRSLDGSGRVHFVGIGGVGMSAIAKVLVERSVSVSGSDLKRSRAATMLEAIGASVHIGHSEGLVDGAGTVIVSSAIHRSNPEVARARQSGIPILTRGEALAAVLSGKDAIVVAGTHGKTTTTSMIVSIMRSAGRDPTYLVGGELNDIGTNARSGSDDVAIAESDESDGSFLLLEPWVGVVTNIEADHLDHWGTLAALREGFARFVGNVRPGGAVVIPVGDHSAMTAALPASCRTVTFGAGGDVDAVSVELGGTGTRFTLKHRGDDVSVEMRILGSHNVANALAAAAAALEAGISLEEVAAGLGLFRGVERRFQVRGHASGVTVVDDYAHHPTEVRATLAAARPGPYERVVAIFQPHRYSRTADLCADFGAAFDDADRVVITDVYGAGEQPVPGVSGKLVADAVCVRLRGRPVAYLPHRQELLSYLEKLASPGDILLTLGAGDISSVGDELLERLAQR